MNWIIENWYMVIIGVIALIFLGIGVYKFVKLPNTDKLKKVKEILLYWVTLAEKEYGSGTGEIKLRWVYDKFTSKYKFLSLFISFERFKKWVDEALEQMREILKTNNAVKQLVETK